MNKDKTINGGTIAAKLPKDASRRDRWHYHVSKRLAEIAANHTSGLYFPAELIEQAEGRPLADIITSRICWKRGFDVETPNYEQKFLLEVDTSYESEASKRVRDNHERSVSYVAVEMILHNPFPNDLFTYDELRQLVRKYYRKGDHNITSAMNRAARAAVVG